MAMLGLRAAQLGSEVDWIIFILPGRSSGQLPQAGRSRRIIQGIGAEVCEMPPALVPGRVDNWFWAPLWSESQHLTLGSPSWAPCTPEGGRLGSKGQKPGTLGLLRLDLPLRSCSWKCYVETVPGEFFWDFEGGVTVVAEPPHPGVGYRVRRRPRALPQHPAQYSARWPGPGCQAAVALAGWLGYGLMCCCILHEAAADEAYRLPYSQAASPRDSKPSGLH